MRTAATPMSTRRSSAASARRLRLAVAVAGLAVVVGAALAATYQVSQRGRTFSVRTMTVAVGDVVRFLNDDEFIHQIYVAGRNFTFDSAEAEPGAAIDVRFTAATSTRRW
jgi:plastocyanin